MLAMYWLYSAFMAIASILIMYSLINSKKSSSNMIFMLIMMIMMLCILMYIVSKKSWLSISLFLATVGGLMILFSLIASIYPKSINNSFQNHMFILIISLLIMFSLSMNFSPTSNYVKTFYMKISVIFMIILMLNLMLIYISKMIISPLKPFRSSG